MTKKTVTAKAYFNQLFSTAKEAHQSGDYRKAISLYKQLIRDIAGHPEPYHMLALVYIQKNQPQDAAELFEKAIEINPKNPTYLNNYAELLQRQNQDKKAIHLLRKAVEIQPDFFQAKNKLATILKKTFQFEESAGLFKEVIAAQPDFEPAYFQLGTLMLETGNFKSAKGYLLQSTKLNPKNVKGLNNLAIAYQEWEDFDEAIDHFQRAIAIDPNYPDALRNLALLKEKIGETADAKKYLFQLAVQQNNDPLILWKAELMEPAVFDSNKSIETFRDKVRLELDNIKSQKIKVDVDQLTKLDIHPPSAMIYHGLDDLQIKTEYGRLFDKIPKVKLSEKRNSKPHIGFVVTGGHEGVFVKCMSGMLNNLSTDKFDITVVCSFPNGEKIVRPKAENPAVKFINLPKSLSEGVRLLTSLNFDFLHYWEVGTDCYNYFIPFFKPARIQCISWGWPITSGNLQMDYFLSCQGLDDEKSQDFFSEKVVLFNKLPVYYYRPDIPELKMVKSNFGIDEHRNIYLCTQNIRKIHPDFDAITCGILGKDENAVVVFLGDKHPVITKTIEERVKKSCLQHSDRIIFLERLEKDRYFNLLNLSSVVLDTLHYNGGANTNYDAFAVNAPVVTMPTKFHRGRYTATAYRQMGFEDLIVHSVGEYVARAVKVATDPTFKSELCAKIKDNSHKIFEDKEAVAELEDFFEKTYHREILNAGK